MSNPTAEVEDNIKTALDYKNKGNALFKSGEFLKATVQYSKIPLYLNHLTQGTAGVTEEHLKEIKDLKLNAYVNSATCYLKLSKAEGGDEQVKLKQLEQGLDQCETALKVEENYGKAIWRRGQLYLHRGNLDWARRDLVAAAKAFPKEATIRKEIEELEERERKQEKRHKKELKEIGPKMLENIAKEVDHDEKVEKREKRLKELKEKREKEAGIQKEKTGLKPGEGMFDDSMWRKLEMDPITRTYLYDPYFVKKMKELQNNPNLLKMFTMIKEPRVIEGLGVIMGFGRDGLKNCHVGGSMGPPPDYEKMRRRRRKEERKKKREEENEERAKKGLPLIPEPPKKEKKKKQKTDEEKEKEKKEPVLGPDGQPLEEPPREEEESSDDEPLKDGDYDSDEDRGPPPMSVRPEMGFARLRPDHGLIKQEVEMLCKRWENQLSSGMLDITVNSVPNNRVLLMSKADAMSKAKEFMLDQPEVMEFEWADIKEKARKTHVPLKGTEEYQKKLAAEEEEERLNPKPKPKIKPLPNIPEPKLEGYGLLDKGEK